MIPTTQQKGLIYAEIELINGDDLALARKHIIGRDDIKHMTATALVDTGSYMLAINEDIKQQLQFTVVGTRKARTADGHFVNCEVVGPVEIRFHSRRSTCGAIVLPGDQDIRLGRIPMEDMDVAVDHVSGKLIVNPEPRRFVHLKVN